MVLVGWPPLLTVLIQKQTHVRQEEAGGRDTHRSSNDQHTKLNQESRQTLYQESHEIPVCHLADPTRVRRPWDAPNGGIPSTRVLLGMANSLGSLRKAQIQLCRLNILTTDPQRSSTKQFCGPWPLRSCVCSWQDSSGLAMWRVS